MDKNFGIIEEVYYDSQPSPDHGILTGASLACMLRISSVQGFRSPFKNATARLYWL